MDKKVFKFKVQPGSNLVAMHERAIPRAVGLDPADGQPAMWAEVDPHAPMFNAHVMLVGTGHPLPPEAARFVGTIVGHNSMFVWHVYVDTVQPWGEDRV